MTDHKFTDDDLEKTLHICSHYAGNCSDYCPLRNDDECVQTMARNALARINRQKAENEELVRNTYKLKSEAIKEFAERLCEGRVSNDPVVIAAKCLLKEMIEEAEL